MSSPLNILIVDDNPSDAELLADGLRSAGFELKWHRVDTESEFLGRLDDGLDLVLADYRMPRFSGLRALRLLKERGLDVPFIIVSGSISEEIALAALKEGASDYLLKDRLGRSGPAVASALEHTRLRRERKRVEKELRDSELRYRLLFESNPQPMWVYDLETLRFLAVNDAAISHYGFARDEFLAMTIKEIRPPEELPKLMKHISGNMPSLAKSGIWRHRTRDGSLIEIEIVSHDLKFGDRPSRLVLAMDVTARVRAERRRQLEHSVTAILAEATPISESGAKILETLCRGLQWDVGELWIADRSAKVLRCSAIWHPPSTEFLDFIQESRQLVFASGEGFAGRIWASGQAEWCADIVNDPSCKKPAEVRRLGLHGWIGFPIKVRHDVLGVAGFFSARVQPPDEEMLETLANLGAQIGQYIERQQLAEQVRQAQKMEAIGTLAGGIAHDFNNIIAAIAGYTELAKMEVGNAGVVEHLDAVLSGTKRAVLLVRQILAFSHRQEQARKPIQLHHVIREVLQLLRATIPSTIEFDVSPAADLPPVLADATQIHQVVMNLCTNAAHAMKECGGVLGVKLERYDVGPELAEHHAGLRPGRHVRLSISDTGHGMDETTLRRIFEPFYTTKAPGEGTGLGLAVVHGIMQTHEGAVTVYSRPGEGAMFRLYFPVAEGEIAAENGDPLQFARGSGERVLYVDDEAPLAQMGRKVLEKLGYAVDAHTSPEKALEAVRADPSRYDVVITDLAMPGLMGTQLAQEVTAIRPDLPVILVSGYSANLTAGRVQALGARELLLKPLSVHALSESVHRVLKKSNPS